MISILFHMHCYNYISLSTSPLGSTTCSPALHPVLLSTRMEVDLQKSLPISFAVAHCFYRPIQRSLFLSLRNPGHLENSWYKNYPVSLILTLLWASFWFSWFIPEPGETESSRQCNHRLTQLHHVFFPLPLLITPNVQIGFDHCWALSQYSHRALQYNPGPQAPRAFWHLTAHRLVYTQNYLYVHHFTFSYPEIHLSF